MADILQRIELHTPEQGTEAMRRAWPWAKDQLQAGRALVAEYRLLEDARSIQQNAFYWSFVLKTISEQARINGVGALAEGWHLYMKRKHLGYRFHKTTLPGKRRPSVTRELRSTTKLSVPKMSKYLDAVMAEAATDFGVAFEPGRRWEEWRA